ncbi:hypothetical protein [Bradyrhizobium sp. ARR65]|uniref:hypothetical protein n=1 Tax=Bradyrhizobium sp. ARR65 TaxID=1040989 RepID=UPI0004654982|nr:hypothetical protein [Bradyrhizobium sp. ARR65]
MSKAEDMPDSDRGQSDRDPVTGLFLAMRDAWLALATANRQGFVNPGGGAAADLPRGGQRGSVITDFVLPMGHATMIATNRSISYWLNLAQILGNYQARSIQALGGEGIDGSVAGSERLVEVDEVRALLREVGDLATKEARLLQSEFGMLAESLAQSFQPSDQSGPYRRRWRSKI